MSPRAGELRAGDVLFLVTGGCALALAGMVTVASLFALLVLYDPISTFVPSAENIRGRDLAEFRVEDTELRGLYGDPDVPTVVFEYHTGVVDRWEFEERVTRAAAESGWDRAPDLRDTLRFQRYKQGWGPAEVRLRMDPETHRVRVAWTCGKNSRRARTFDDAREARWAERHLWPQLYE